MEDVVSRVWLSLGANNIDNMISEEQRQNNKALKNTLIIISLVFIIHDSKNTNNDRSCNAHNRNYGWCLG